MSKNDEFCIDNEVFYVENEGFCIENDEFCRTAAIAAEVEAAAESLSGDVGEPSESTYKQQKVHKRQMFGLDERRKEQAKKTLQIDPEKRTKEQIKDLVEWTMDIDLFYGLTEQQRVKLCGVIIYINDDSSLENQDSSTEKW